MPTRAEHVSAKERVALGLAVLSVVNRSRQPLTQEEIADVCGCSRAVIWKIEHNALAKLRGKLGELVGLGILDLEDLLDPCLTSKNLVDLFPLSDPASSECRRKITTPLTA